LNKASKNDFNTFFKNYDAVICKHVDSPHAAKNIQLACEKAGIPLIYDLDDDLLSIREDNPAHDSYKQGAMKRVYLATNLSFADALFVSTEPLKERYQTFFKEVMRVDVPVYVLPNYNDAELYDFKTKTNENKVVIGYHGSITHDKDLSMVLPVIDQLMYKYPNLHMQLVGTVRRESLNTLFAPIYNKMRFEIKAGTPAFDEFPKLLMKMRWDIGIAPLIDDVFNRGKSHIKYMEYAMKKIPVVASDVYPYSKNAKHALLAKNPAQFKQRLETLIKDKKYRYELGQKAYEHVTTDLQYKDHAQEWVNAVQSVIENKR